MGADHQAHISRRSVNGATARRGPCAANVNGMNDLRLHQSEEIFKTTGTESGYSEAAADSRPGRQAP